MQIAPPDALFSAKRVSGRRGEHHSVGKQLLKVQFPARKNRAEEANIKALLKERVDLHRRRHFRKNDVHLRKPQTKLLKDRSQQVVRQRSNIADGQVSENSPTRVLSAKFGALYVAQDLSSVLEERCPRRGKANRPLTPLKKWHTEFDFQVPDLHAQRRLRYVKLLRGPAEVPFLRDAHKISQAAKVHDADYTQNV